MISKEVVSPICTLAVRFEQLTCASITGCDWRQAKECLDKRPLILQPRPYQISVFEVWSLADRLDSFDFVQLQQALRDHGHQRTGAMLDALHHRTIVPEARSGRGQSPETFP